MANYDLLGVPKRGASHARFYGFQTTFASAGGNGCVWPSVAFQNGEAIKAMVDAVNGSYFTVLESGLYATHVSASRAVNADDEFYIIRLTRPAVAAETNVAYNGANVTHVCGYKATTGGAAVSVQMSGHIFLNAGDRLYMGNFGGNGLNSSGSSWDLIKVI